MSKINSKLIEKACHDLCVEANTNYDENLYKIVENMYAAEKNDSTKNKLANIIKNAQIAHENKRPLCQDTGQVIVFIYIGQQVQIEGDNINKAINKGIEKAYKKNYYRQSVVKDALFNRNNTNTNTPAIIYTEFTDTDYIEIKMMIKGAGSENYSAMQMLKPTSTKEEIFNFIKNCLEQAGEKSCPPYVLGIGVGGTAEKALLLSKEAFFEKEQNTQQKEFINELNQHLQGLTNNILEIKLKTAPTHIACLPIGITINCHSCRHSVCKITQNEIIIDKNNNKFKTIEDKNINLKEIHTNDIEEIRKLKSGEEILLTGEVYTARDAATCK
jgi:fumarate hydratase subunit alpha